MTAGGTQNSINTITSQIAPLPGAGLRWYAVQVKPRFERPSADALGHKGYEVLNPVYRSPRRWSDRLKNVELPLFPGYVFARFDAMQRLPVLTTPHILSVVSMGKIPAPVEESEIEAIRRATESGIPAEPFPYLRVGQRVRVLEGALQGVEGILMQVKGWRLVISVTLLQRSISVGIEGIAVEAVDVAAPPCDVIRYVPASRIQS